MQRKSSSCQNTCDTRVACRIIVAESKLFVAYFSGGVGAAQFDYADDYDEEVSYLLGPPLQRQIICRQLWMPIYPFRQLESSRMSGRGRIPQAVAANCCCPQSGPRAACLSYQLISMQRAAAIGHVDWQCEWQWVACWLGLSRTLLNVGHFCSLAKLATSSFLSFFLFFFWEAILRAVRA